MGHTPAFLLSSTSYSAWGLTAIIQAEILAIPTPARAARHASQLSCKSSTALCMIRFFPGLNTGLISQYIWAASHTDARDLTVCADAYCTHALVWIRG